MENCPDCGAHLSGGWVQRTREVIELPVVPVQVTEQVYIARTCPACRRRCTPPAVLDGVVLGQQRLGVNLLSLIATLREEGRLPIRSVQWYLDTVHQLRLSVGAIHRTAQRAQPAVAAILNRIRASPVVHADETGWRQSGANGYVWTFSTATERYFLRRGRGKTVVDEALSDAFSGVLVSDFYAAYHHYDDPKQRCWAHLLRDIHHQRTLYPDAAPLATWADAVHGIYDRAQSLHSSPGQAAAHRPTGPGTTTAGPLPAFPARPVGNSGQAVPTHRAPHQEPAPYWIRGTLRLRGRTRSAFRQQRRRTQPATSGHQPQDQRRHPVGAGHRAQDDAGIHLRHPARPRSKSSRRLPSAARFPSTLNCYNSVATMPNDNNFDRPIFDDYAEWYLGQFSESLSDGRAENWHDHMTLLGKARLEGSQFWGHLQSHLPTWDNAYIYEHGGYPLLAGAELASIDTKSFNSTLNKAFRWNVRGNENWPDPPVKPPSTAPSSDEIMADDRDRWYGPHNWLTDFPDIFRTRLITTYFDGVTYLSEKVMELARETTDQEPQLKLQASSDGYHAAHLWVYHEFDAMGYHSREYSPTLVCLEIQVTTTIQATISRMLHDVYEDWRLNGPPQDWQWDHLSQAFSVNYLGTTLHYLEGMIVMARNQWRDR